ncbi:hypothetical protein LO80_03865 [Candidatus Francisella endociliophora]|uniref:Major facilitator transporter n=1 Tax=Candidatus Francisella endociliophora TaxID=653937 RepID=A0A097ENQ1_9GAMM|nr:oligopeptide:H+ symporter [Francisella sp. FSC1006]AIT09191.1 hypothetical protein LO80_03865 [Francisella sp. FSC1006]
MKNTRILSLPFWVIWSLELWERYGFYGIQSILMLFLIDKLNFTEAYSYTLFGTFNAFLFAFIWFGGWIGDRVIGAKRTIIIGAIFLLISYASLAFISDENVYYSLAGIIVGNALFKANPSSLISKLYKDNPEILDCAITLYYMSISVGCFIATVSIPLLSQYFGWGVAFVSCAIGLIIGLIGYLCFYNKLSSISTIAGGKSLNFKSLVIVLIGSITAIYIIGILLIHTVISNILVVMTLITAVGYYLLSMKDEDTKSRIKMFVALLLFAEAIIFFVMYNQMPSTLILFVKNNVNHTILGYSISPAQYYIFNPMAVLIFSPILSKIYTKYPSTHATKFCAGMTICSVAFLILYIPQFISTSGIVSSWWVIMSYFFISIGELLISALGLSMMLSLCPKRMSGFVCGFWFLSTMLAGPISGWVGKLTAVNSNITAQESIQTYGNVFGSLGLVVAITALLMWLARPYLNRLLKN